MWACVAFLEVERDLMSLDYQVFFNQSQGSIANNVVTNRLKKTKILSTGRRENRRKHHLNGSPDHPSCQEAGEEYFTE